MGVFHELLVLVVIPGSLRSPDCTHLAQRLGAIYHCAPPLLNDENILAWYERTVAQSPQARRLRWILIGLGAGADTVAREYYRFFSVKSPEAMVLLEPRARTIHLNLITCPYLIAHEDRAWFADPVLRGRTLEAVHHHQARYGDATEHRVVESSEEAGVLESERLDPRVEDAIVDWLEKDLRLGRRSQEPWVA